MMRQRLIRALGVGERIKLDKGGRHTSGIPIAMLSSQFIYPRRQRFQPIPRPLDRVDSAPIVCQWAMVWSPVHGYPLCCNGPPDIRNAALDSPFQLWPVGVGCVQIWGLALGYGDRGCLVL